ncbi:MAG: hypothetical protein KKF68_01620 [Nanoarchaeota archaeon]|nr:hypothetical protein [Nanoarchaeota archaeon]
MVYKRYINRDGEKYGPYYYESYRSADGGVKTKYLKDYKPTKKRDFFLIFSLLVSISLGVTLLIFALNFIPESKIDSINTSPNEASIEPNFKSKMNLDNSIPDVLDSIKRIIGFTFFNDSKTKEIKENSEKEAEQKEEHINEIEKSVEETVEINETKKTKEEIKENKFSEKDIEKKEKDIEKQSSKVKKEINELEIIQQDILEDNLTILNINITQYDAVINQPVKWKKNVKLDKLGAFKIELPKEAENIIVFMLDEEQEEFVEGTIERKTKRLKQEVPKNKVKITGKIFEKSRSDSFVSIFFNKISNFLTGKTIDIYETNDIIEVLIEENSTEYEIEYETPGPVSFEEDILMGKRIIISSDVHYENILAYSELPIEVPRKYIKLYHNHQNGSKVEVDFETYDTNNNDLYDFIEWVVPHLSNQTYELIIEIIKAEHLDENRNFISDIYESVKILDNNWSELINDKEYVRVVFEHELDSSRDITIYPRIVNGTPKIEVYEINGNELIAEFTDIANEEYNKVYLTDLSGTQNSFDLKVIGGSVEFDHIVDPIESEISFVAPTLENNSFIEDTWVEVNVSINNSGLNEVKFNWNGTNYTIYNDSVILKMDFNNFSELGENSTYFADVSKNANNGSCTGSCPDFNSSCKYGGCYDFSSDYIDIVGNEQIYDLTENYSISLWFYMDAYNDLYDGIISKTDSSNNGWLLYFVSTTDKLTFLTSGAAYFSVGPVASTYVGKWTHVLISADSTTAYIYLNGSYYGSGGLGKTTNNLNLTIGRLRPYAAANYFSGKIDDIIIWNRSLSLNEAQQVYFSNLHKYDSDKWLLYINQSKSSTSGLDGGLHTYFASAKNSAGYENMTDIRSITIVTPPNVNLITPENNNNSVSLTQNITFNCSATGTIGSLKNITLYTNISGVWQAEETKDLTGTFNSTIFEVDAKSLIGDYVFKDSVFDWNCLAYNLGHLSSWNSSNYTFSGWDLGNYSNLTSATNTISSNSSAGDLTNVGLSHYTDASQAGHIDGTLMSDDNTGTYIQTYSYIAVDFGSLKNIKLLRMHSLNSVAYTSWTAGTLRGSTDSTNGVDGSWDTLTSLSGLQAPVSYPGWSANLTFANSNSYNWYKIDGITKTTNAVGTEWEMMEVNTLIINTTNSNISLIANSTGEFENMTGSYESKIFDGLATKSWKNISWDEITPSGTSINVSARSCNDDVCSGENWNYLGSNSTYETLSTLTENRYFQYKLDFYTNDTTITPGLLTRSVVVRYDLETPVIPNVTLVTPANNNNSVSLTSNLTFNCSAADSNENLKNITLYTNVSGVWQAEETKDLTGSYNSTTFEINLTSLIGNYVFKDSQFDWNCLVYDELSLSNWSDNNHSFSGWDFGNYTNVTFNFTNNNISLIANSTGKFQNTTGNYQSKIFDGLTTRSWENLTWEEALPYEEELPDNQDTESVSGGMNMTGNVLLMHLNNDSAIGENDTYVYDFSGSGNNGTCSGGASYTATKILGQYGLYFVGDNDYINPANYRPTYTLSDSFTWSGWIKTSNTAGSWLCLFCGRQSTSSATDMMELYIGTGYLRTWNRDASNNEPKYTGSVIFVSDNNWHHIAMVRDVATDKFYLYKDGVQEINFQDTSTNSFRITADFRIAGEGYGGGRYYFPGYMDEIAFWNRSLSAEEISDTYKRGILRLNVSARSCNDILCDTEQYANFGSNATLTDISSLNENRYFQYKLNFETDNYNYTPELLTHSVVVGYGESSGNNPPNEPSPDLISLDGTNQTASDLNCTDIITDNDAGDKLNVTVIWYKNDVENLTVDYNNSYDSGTNFGAILNATNTSKTENWTCSMRFYDGTDYSSWVNSTNLTILNTLPVVTLTFPDNNNITTNRTQRFNWTASDADGDSLTYQMNITLHALSLCTDPTREDTGISVQTYIPSPYLNCLKDNNDYYNWTVRASDDGDATYGDWATPRKIEIQSEIQVSLPVDVVNFGSIIPGETNDTTDNSPLPFEIQNDGNCMLNITLNATNLLDSVSNPSANFRYKIDNKSGENGSFSFQSNVEWTQMPLIAGLAIIELNWSDDTDMAEVDLEITVPTNEPSGNKSSIIYFISSLGE